jgi:hypothetical protein
VFKSELICKSWIASWLLTYWSPNDIVYKELTFKKSPFRLAVAWMEAVDGLTTVWGRVDKVITDT